MEKTYTYIHECDHCHKQFNSDNEWGRNCPYCGFNYINYIKKV